MKFVKLFLISLFVTLTFINCDSTQPYTLYFDVAEKGGEGVYFYVYELETYEHAKKILEGFEGFYNEKIENINAEEVAQKFLYLEVYAPVCGRVLEEENKDYENDYNFKGQVFLRAHKDGKAYGYWKRGKCQPELVCGGIAGFQCPEGYTCVIEDTYPDAMGHCELIECPALMPPHPDLCPDGTFMPVYDEEGICVVGFECQKNCPSIVQPKPEMCPEGKFEPRYDEEGICVMGFNCIQHKPECKHVGTRSEGWYWQDTGERIKWEKCEGKATECINIGTRSEGWNIRVDGHVLFDFCAEEVGIERHN